MTDLSMWVLQMLGHYLKAWGEQLEYKYLQESSRRFLKSATSDGRTKEQVVQEMFDRAESPLARKLRLEEDNENYGR